MILHRAAAAAPSMQRDRWPAADRLARDAPQQGERFACGSTLLRYSARARALAPVRPPACLLAHRTRSLLYLGQ